MCTCVFGVQEFDNYDDTKHQHYYRYAYAIPKLSPPIMHVLRCVFSNLHVLELVHAALGVAFADLAQRLVLVPPLAHVLPVDLVVRRLHRVVPGQGEVLLEGLVG